MRKTLIALIVSAALIGVFSATSVASALPPGNFKQFDAGQSSIVQTRDSLPGDFQFVQITNTDTGHVVTHDHDLVDKTVFNSNHLPS